MLEVFRLRPLSSLSVLLTAAALLPGLAGCVGDIGGSGDEAPPPPDVTPKNVPAAPEVVDGDGFCVALDDGEALHSVSPEGHAWFARQNGDTFELRVVDPFAPAAELVDGIELSSVQRVVALSQTDAAVIADGALWRLEDLARIELTAPTALSESAGVCGDPLTNGALLSSGDVFERRDEHWWGWDSGVSGAGAPASILRYEGECQQTDNAMWLTAEDGTLWKLEPQVVSRPVKFAALVDGAATAGMLALLEADRLWIGPEPWQSWVFPGPVPTRVAASGGYVWMLSGEQLLRFDGSAFIEIKHELAGSLVALDAHAGGVWLAAENEACHYAAAPMIRIDGVRPYTRSLEFDYPFRVKASEGDLTLTASLGGEDIPLAAAEEEGWLEGKARLDTVGWHQLELSASDGGVTSSRRLAVKRLPSVVRGWAEDIEPIYQADCTGGDCHGSSSPSNPPDLSTFEAWTELANEIRVRVVDAKTMPPPSSQGADWGDDKVEIIAQWLEGGMLP